MRIPIDTIESRGRRIDAGKGDVWAERAASTALDGPPAELAVGLDLSVTAGVVFVSGSVRASVRRPCDRCGEPVILAVDEAVDLAYAPEGPTSEQHQLTAGDLDLGWYHEGHLDLEEVLSEAIALALPSRVLCTDGEACEARTRALLAEGTEETGHPAFAALAGLRRD